MSDIFISYKREDRAKAKALAEFLIGKGFDVWWDINLLAGQQFANEIDIVLRKAKAAIVLWTPQAAESKWVRSEATLANSRNILVPVFLEKTELQIPFNILHTHNLTTWNGQSDDPVLEKLINDVERLTGKPKNKKTHETKDDIRHDLLNPEIEFKYWASVTSRKPQSVKEYQFYLDQFGDDGWFAELAKTRIADLTIKGSGKNTSVWFSLFFICVAIAVGIWIWKSPVERTEELTYESNEGENNKELTYESKPLQSNRTDAVTKELIKHLPEMVYIPAGFFKMGSPVTEAGHTDNESPVHDVSINPFYIGKYEVTFAEYDEFATATYKSISDDEGWGRDTRPMHSVNWNDAQAYVDWLSSKMGRRYRLPSESEWEYVARAGSTTRYWWGNNVSVNNANCGGCGSEWDGKSTAPVGLFEANAFGVFNTVGNVKELVEDCWHDDYTDAPGDGRAWLGLSGGNCNRRVARGGSWYSLPDRVRSASRINTSPEFRSISTGFRLAHDL